MGTLYSVDCERFIPNRFHLVLVAAARAREIARGAVPRAEGEGSTGMRALREIAAGRIEPDEIQALLTSPGRHQQELIAHEETDEDALREGMAQAIAQKTPWLQARAARQ